MPTISRIFIKSGLLFMVASLVVALGASAGDMLGLPGWVVGLRSTYFHLFTVGWITQIIFGVALWMFPGWSRKKPRGPAWLGWSCFAALNGGLLLRFASETAFAAGHHGGLWSWMMTAAAILLVAAAMLFAAAVWPRLKSREKRRRQAKKRRQEDA